MLQGAPADNDVVAVRWAETLRFVEMASQQGVGGAQTRCGRIYANGGRSVPQNWATTVKWWRKAAQAGDVDAEWFIGLCYYYGRWCGSERPRRREILRLSKLCSWASRDRGGFGKTLCVSRSAPPRHTAAHQFAGDVHEHYLASNLQLYNDALSLTLSCRISPLVTACG
jgi:TPR repeat protein